MNNSKLRAIAFAVLLLGAESGFAQALQGDYDPSLGTLPTQQGWNSISSGLTSTSISQGTLHELSAGQFWARNVGSINFDSASGFKMDLNLDMVSGDYSGYPADWRTDYFWDVEDSQGRSFTIGIASGGLQIANDSNLTYGASTPFIPFNVTSGFHDYQIAINSSGLSLGIDNVPVPLGSLPLGSTGIPGTADTVRFGTQAYGQSETYLHSLNWTVQGVPAASASPIDNAFVDVNNPQPSPGASTTIAYANLDILPGGSYTLALNDTLDLGNGSGTLYIRQGAVFTGNGIIQGNVQNAGLARIPIVSLSAIHGGHVIIPTVPGLPGQPILISAPATPPILNPGTIIGFANSASGGGGGGGGGGVGGSGGGAGGSFIYNGSLPSVGGTVQLDASLEVTGSFTQTATGALRLFIGGSDPGVTYSQLTVDSSVSLAGGLQVALEPELQNFLPTTGETFDVVVGKGGITIDPNGIQIVSLVTSTGSSYLSGLNLQQSAFDSGISSDPDSLNVLNPSLWNYALIDDNTVLELTYQGPSAAPEPTALSLMALGGMGMLARRRVVCRQSSKRIAEYC